MKSEPYARYGHENGDLLSEHYNCIMFCLLNTTHYCTSDFVSGPGIVQKEANGNDTFRFLNFEFI